MTEIPLHTIFTPSHKPLLDRFVETARASGFAKVCVTPDETLGDGSWATPDFREVVTRKMHLVLGLAKFYNQRTGPSAPFIYSDCDIVFNRWATPTASTLIERGMALRPSLHVLTQRDANIACTGFMVLRPSQWTIDFLTLVCAVLDKEVGTRPNFFDQDAFNTVLQAFQAQGKDLSMVGMIDIASGFGNLSHVQPNGMVWDPDRHGPVMDYIGDEEMGKCCMWHANWCIGTGAKMRMVQEIEEFWRSRVPVHQET